MRGTQLAEEEVVPLLAPVMPLVYRYFAEHRPDALPGYLFNGGGGTDEGEAPPQPAPAPQNVRGFLSECQLLVTDPGAVPQIWHRDNRQPGLTVLMPLTDVDDEVGPTQLLPGTHHLVAGGAIRATAALQRSGGSASAVPLVPGDLLVYDARLLHRGLGNMSYNRCRVIFAMRFDYTDTPPPGATVLQTQAARLVGALLDCLGSFYTLLPVPGSSSGGSSGGHR